MEKINTEILVSSLFAIGFDRVDPLLFTYTLGQLSIDNQELQLFEFEDSETHQLFNIFVDYDGIVYKLKDGLTIDTEVICDDVVVYPLIKLLNTNKKLIEYLSQLDFRKIIKCKIDALGPERIDKYDELFSSKEKEIMYEMYGTKQICTEEGQNELYFKLSSQEVREVPVKGLK